MTFALVAYIGIRCMPCLYALFVCLHSVNVHHIDYVGPHLDHEPPQKVEGRSTQVEVLVEMDTLVKVCPRFKRFCWAVWFSTL